MPSYTAPIPDLRSPKSPKRFFGFGRETLPPPPPIPPTIAFSPSPSKVSHKPNASDSLDASFALGQGAQVVRRPSDARRGMRQPLTAGLVTPISRNDGFRPFGPTSAPVSRGRPSEPGLPSASAPVLRPDALISNVPKRSTLKIKTSISSSMASSSPSCETPGSAWDLASRRTTVKPPPRPLVPIAFHAIMLSHSIKASPGTSSHILIALSFAYSLEDPSSNTLMTIPWEKLYPAGGHLVRFVERHLGREAVEEGKPHMTDGESAEDSDLESDYSLGALLREEYLQSLLLTSSPPSKTIDLPSPPLPSKADRNRLSRYEVPETRKRAHTRNQYAQQHLYPSPSSPFVHFESINIRRKAPALTLEPREVYGGGTITELKILLCRDAAVYGPIIHRLIRGVFPLMECRRRRVEEELVWLGMEGLSEEIAVRARGRKSMVLRGGEGYI